MCTKCWQAQRLCMQSASAILQTQDAIPIRSAFSTYAAAKQQHAYLSLAWEGQANRHAGKMAEE